MKCKIGIRPVIDGRCGGIRESLEEQTMNMAKSAKALIESNCFYSDGTPVECVISNTTIGGSAEACKCEEQFATENVVATLTVTPCWCYGTEVIDINPNTIKAVWGFNGTERPGAVFLACAVAASAQRGLPIFSIYGKDVQDIGDTIIPEDVKQKILSFAKCAIAVGQMKNKTYVGLGAVSMGIAGSFLDGNLMQQYFGIRAEWVDMVEIDRRINLGIYDEKEYEKALSWIKANCKEGEDINDYSKPRIVLPKEKLWEYIAKMTVIVNDIMFGNPKLKKMGFPEEANGRNAIAGGFQGQRQWIDRLPNGDFMEAIMNTSFDWRGKKEPFILATENDTLNGMSMLINKLITNRASIFADVRTYWSPDAVKRVTGWTPDGLAKNGFIHMINSGAAALDGIGACKDENGNPCMKEWWKITKEDIKATMDNVKWSQANLDYFRGGGFSSNFKTIAEMPVTAVRINMVDGLGPVLQIAEGYTAVIPDEVDTILQNRTDRTWPSTWFVPNLTGEGAFKDVYSVMANWGANHAALAYGHVGADLITIASMLRIPVNMHNVSEDRLFRPHTWTAFGTKDLESADYRACKTYGPLYK
ncbi:MAG: L-fucose isomerase [Clostridia bacterium]|nr:L-fucose isomerase [Clostridia bacterium]